MGDPVVAQKASIPVEVEEGKHYFWCLCGKSAKQPFCDGSHKDTGMTPLKITAPANKKVFFCGCKNQLNRHFVTVPTRSCSQFIAKNLSLFGARRVLNSRCQNQ